MAFFSQMIINIYLFEIFKSEILQQLKHYVYLITLYSKNLIANAIVYINILFLCKCFED